MASTSRRTTTHGSGYVPSVTPRHHLRRQLPFDPLLWPSPSTSVTLQSCQIYSNSASQHGGGLSASSSCTVTLNSCDIYSNTVTATVVATSVGGFRDDASNYLNSGGGGVAITNCIGNTSLCTATFPGFPDWIKAANDCGSGTVTINNCNIHSNQATASGGGVLIIGGTPTVTLNSCDIYSNFAAYGGGARIAAGTVTLDTCNIYNNQAFNPTYNDGGGGANIELFKSITAGTGTELRVTFRSCQIYSNSAMYRGQPGGGLSVAGAGTTTLMTTRIYDNTAPIGANLSPTGGILYYALPTVPGSWLPNSDCVANRLPCEAWNTACKNAGCSLKAGTSTDSPTPWTPTDCKAPINIQPCDWQTAACAANPPTADCLLGKKIFFVPYFPSRRHLPLPVRRWLPWLQRERLSDQLRLRGQVPIGLLLPQRVDHRGAALPAWLLLC